MDHGRLIQTALAESAGGAAAGIVADSVLYAIDSAKVRAQTKPVAGATGVGILFRGLAPTILLGSVPVFGSFFFVYAPIRTVMQDNGYDVLLPVASVICAVPATVIGVPADVLKKRLVLGMDRNVGTAISRITAEQGWKGLFAGWHVNLVRDLPFAGVKIGLYEWFIYRWKLFHGMQPNDPISTLGAAGCGVASGVACAIITCPLDVVNTQIKAGGVDSTSIPQVAKHIVQREGVPALFRGVAMRSVVLGIGSSIFWPIQRQVAQTFQPCEKCPFVDPLYEF